MSSRLDALKRELEEACARQRQAVRHFLEYIRDEKHDYRLEVEEIQDALARYWARADPSDSGRGK